MCIIEHKTYIDSDGERIVETAKPCRRATSTNLCHFVEHRNVGPIRLVEAIPRPRPRPTQREEGNSSDRLLITEGLDGRGKVYRDVSTGSSIRSSVRGSTIMSERSTPSSASSPSFVEVKPKAPTPPSAGSGSPFVERIRSPWPPTSPPVPPVSPPDPRRIVTPEGTAIYDRPPSLELPRAVENERPRRFEPTRKASVSSMKAEVNDADDGPSSSPPRRKPNISIDTALQPSVSSSSGSVGPQRRTDGPRVGILRHRSTRESTRRDSKQPERQRTGDERRRDAERDRNRLEEENYQAERIRFVEPQRRRSVRDERTRETSRERHRRETEDALVGLRDDPIEAQINADIEQMARERDAAAARQRESDPSLRYDEDQFQRDVDARDRTTEGRNSPTITRTRRTIDENISSPPLVSTRSSTYPVTIHQSVRERGERVIAREQALGATQRLNNVLGSGRADERYDAAYGRDGDRSIGEGQEGRRRRRDGRRHK